LLKTAWVVKSMRFFIIVLRQLVLISRKS